MSNNKEYVVVKSSQGSIDLWTKGVYQRYQNGHTIGDGSGHPYTAITAFNADETLEQTTTELSQLREERERMRLALKAILQRCATSGEDYGQAIYEITEMSYEAIHPNK